MQKKVSLEVLISRLLSYGFHIDRTEDTMIWMKGMPGSICITIKGDDYEVSGFMREGYEFYDYV